MKDNLLVTKLFAPKPGPRLVVRSRLVQRLNKSVDENCKLILVSAPVGSGKTILVSSWLSTRNNPFAWLSLEAEDNDPLQFWLYLFSALQSTRPDLGQNALTLLRTTQSPPIENLLRDLINQTTGLSEKIILVLDDYHVLESSDIHRNIKFFLTHLPSQLHLVIITREDPPLPLPQLRAKGQLVEIRAEDLRFTTEESAQFLNQVMRLKLQPEEISALEHRTEGWIAGLQMAAISLQDLEDTTKFIQDFSGDDRYVVDYLVEEVIERQPESVQEFLMRTAILKRFTAPLCDALTGETTGRNTLAYLEETNLFLISLDNKRRWYRYHHLFGSLLQHRLREKVGVEGVNEYHRRAADWLTKKHFTDEAIFHYIASEAFPQAADLMEAIVVNLIAQGQLHKVLTWLAQLPNEFTRTRPLLCASYAWVLVITGQGAAAETWLHEAKQDLADLSAIQAQKIHGVISIVQAFITRNHGDILQSIRLLRQASEEIETDHLILQSNIHLNLGFDYSILGQLSEAEQVLLAARADGIAAQAVYLTLLSMATLGIVCAAEGRLHRAIHHYRKAIAYGLAQNQGYPFAPAGYAYAGLGQALYEQNDLEGAAQHLTQAIEFGELMGDWSMRRRSLLPMAWIKQIQGDSAAALSLWQQAMDVVKQAKSSRLENRLRAHQARLHLLRFTMDPSDRTALVEAADWAESYQQSQPQEHNYQEIFAQTTLAWVDLARGRVDEADARLIGLAEISKINRWGDAFIKVQALRALASAGRGDMEASLDNLEIALARAAPEGYIRTIIDFGQPMRELLHLTKKRGVASAYTDRLLSAYQARDGEEVEAKPQNSSFDQPPLEMLTDQEIHILRLMAAGLSHREIADEIYLSVNTIKWHTGNIYSKLGVHRRAHAVFRAQELGIL